MTKIIKDEIDRYHEYGIHVPSRTIFLSSGSGDEEGENIIDFHMAKTAIKNLHLLDLSAPSGDRPINVIINSAGGDTYHGLAIIDAITACKNRVKVTAYGYCMSMAGWILQAGDNRIMSKNCKLMLHVGSFTLDSDHYETNRRWVNQYIKDEEMFENMLLERIRVKHPKFSRKQVKDMLRFDTLLTPEDALNLNLIDEIL